MRFVESLGHTTFAYAAFPGAELEITAELPAETTMRSGETLRLGVPPRSAHLFDADGRAFRRLADSAAGAA